MNETDLIVYDGVCVLCSRSMRFVAARDNGRHFRFVPLQSSYGSQLATQFGISTENPDTYIAIIDGVAKFRSDATLAILERLPGYGWTRMLRIIPRFIRDACYTLVARHRYKWFGRLEACPLPPPALATLVVTEAPH